MDAREDGVYITYTPVAGADAVTKKLGSNKIYLPKLRLSGEGNVDGDAVFALDGQRTLSIGSITFPFKGTFTIYTNDTLNINYTTNQSNISLNISGATTLYFHYFGFRNNDYCGVALSDITIV